MSAKADALSAAYLDYSTFLLFHVLAVARRRSNAEARIRAFLDVHGESEVVVEISSLVHGDVTLLASDLRLLMTPPNPPA